VPPRALVFWVVVCVWAVTSQVTALKPGEKKAVALASARRCQARATPQRHALPTHLHPPGARVALRNDSYALHILLPSKIDPLVSLMKVSWCNVNQNVTNN
jgi:ATP-dependent 26S proteasome regulatory subunit